VLFSRAVLQIVNGVAYNPFGYGNKPAKIFGYGNHKPPTKIFGVVWRTA